MEVRTVTTRAIAITTQRTTVGLLIKVLRVAATSMGRKRRQASPGYGITASATSNIACCMIP